MKHQSRTQSEVLAWLLEHHPALHLTAEIERSWLWISADLGGDHNKATRESIKAYGFAYKRNGVHILPSGKGGNWSHSCEKPLRFTKRGTKPQQPAIEEMDLEEIAAAFA